MLQKEEWYLKKCCRISIQSLVFFSGPQNGQGNGSLRKGFTADDKLKEGLIDTYMDYLKHS
jgi:hypothetical protein